MSGFPIDQPSRTVLVVDTTMGRRALKGKQKFSASAAADASGSGSASEAEAAAAAEPAADLTCLFCNPLCHDS